LPTISFFQFLDSTLALWARNPDLWDNLFRHIILSIQVIEFVCLGTSSAQISTLYFLYLHLRFLPLIDTLTNLCSPYISAQMHGLLLSLFLRNSHLPPTRIGPAFRRTSYACITIPVALRSTASAYVHCQGSRLPCLNGVSCGIYFL
jgi:hypothetical protein